MKRATDAQIKTLENIKREHEISRSMQKFVSFKGIKDVTKFYTNKEVFYVAPDGSLLERRSIEESEHEEFEEFWKGVHKKMDIVKEESRRDLLVQEYMTNETKCVACGHNTFEVERVSPEQVLLKCDKCSEPHTIDAQFHESQLVLRFWSPKMEKVE